MTQPPYLTLVDGDDRRSDPLSPPDPQESEFVPLPYYPWDERPSTVPLDHDECATAIHLAHGDAHVAAQLLKVPYIRLNRQLRASPRLARILTESLDQALAAAASLPIQTLFDPNADRRSREWASTKLLQSRLAIGHPLSPAPPTAAASASLTVNAQTKTITYRWKSDDDDEPPDG
jgi:hypothetical protein